MSGKLERVVLVVSEVGHTFNFYGQHVVRVGSDLSEWEKTSVVTGPEGSTCIHSGRAWVPFREEFRRVDDEVREPDTILIAHGGSDPHRLTARSLKALEHTRGVWNICVLATDAFENPTEIEQLAASSKHACRIVWNAENVVPWMRRASIALINGGNIRYELCVSQTPFVAISFQPQQYECTEQIARLGVGVNLGEMNRVSDVEIAEAVESLLRDEERLLDMQRLMGSLFDIKGADRILNLLEG